MPPTDPRFSHERMLSREQHRLAPAYWSETSVEGMVATAHYKATEAGAEMLAMGGNALDAAIAASLALCVCEPAESGLGGGAMLLFFDAAAKRNVLVEGACRAPALASPNQVASQNRYRGYQTVAIPTYPAVIDHALSRYGSLSLEQLIAPAIRLAEEGFFVTPLLHRRIARYQRVLSAGNASSIFLNEMQRAWPVGHVLRQPELATTLHHLATVGMSDFYKGDIAGAIITDMKRYGGFIRGDDLERLPEVIQESTPLGAALDGSEIFTLGPPGGGITLIEMLKLFGELDSSDFDPDGADGVVLLAKIIQRARRDRERYTLKTNPDTPGQAAQLLNREFIQRMANRLRVTLPAGGTSHISVMDRFGNAVALSQSIDRDFGAAVASEQLGFLYNDYLNTFNISNERHPHYLRPGARARSNASPTLIFNEGRPRLAIGAAGSGRITSAIFQTLVRLRSQTPFEAVHAPRLHCSPEGSVILEADRFAPEALRALRTHGFRQRGMAPYSHTLGGLQLVIRDQEGFCGVADPRRDGSAAGPATLSGAV